MGWFILKINMFIFNIWCLKNLEYNMLKCLYMRFDRRKIVFIFIGYYDIKYFRESLLNISGM